MKSDSPNSPYFDGIRVKPDKDRRLRSKSEPSCEWPGCQAAGGHRAPKGREEKQYWNFCLPHARDYNASYNYFQGMTVDEIARWQKDSIVGHRPTWKMGQGGTGAATERSSGARLRRDPKDPFGLFREMGGMGAKARADAKAPSTDETRVIRNAQRKALETLGFEANATAAEVKARFKDLVKRHHPDANGGDRSTEDRLREIIQAYKYLKSIGAG